MTSRICISSLLVLLGILSWPKLYQRLAGLELGKPGAEVPLRLLQCAGSFTAGILIWFPGYWFREGRRFWSAVVLFLVVGWLEFSLRVFFRMVLPHLGSVSALRNLERSLWERSNTLAAFSWIEGHPFLQFTATRGATSDGDRGLGFINIKVSDIPKPEGVCRVACLGNSTTSDGYPEQLEDYLNSCGSGRRFQVLNFGVGWWSSIHTMLNFALNVREFRPEFAVVHENCNDEKYRGYPGLRGDCAHAMRTFTYKRHRDEWLYRFSLLYRLGIFPRRYYSPVGGVGMNRGRTRKYVPEELQLFRRNIETICTLAAAEEIRVILATMPYSRVLRYTDFDEERFHSYLRDLNAILRLLAEEKRVDLLDWERLFWDRQQFFVDGFHLGREGAEMKALAAGQMIFRALGITPVANPRWSEVESGSR